MYRRRDRKTLRSAYGQLLFDERGASLVEYALLMALILLGVGGAFLLLVGGIDNLFGVLTNLLASII
ncbi:MAG: Flp family type IVb pilin [Deltaproteobacteria bacterium]|nr:MAG: Flp family type IVb pilin [Deltaproteobacteria bacterium]